MAINRVSPRRRLAALLLALLTTLIVPTPARAQNRVFLNNSFEQFNVAPNNFSFFASGTGNWFNTAGQLEIWGTGFNGVPAQNGQRFAELNASAAGTFYQTVCVDTGDNFTFNFWHRRRDQTTSNPDVMQVVLINPATSAEVTLGTNVSTNGALWVNYTRTFDAATQGGALGITAAGIPLRLGFRAVSSATGNTSVGNFLDNIRMTGLVPFAMLDQTSASGSENVANPVLRILVNGIVNAPVNITLTYGGTATRNVDYTAPSSITIPTGTYDGTSATAIPIPITVVDDGILEPNETIVVTAAGSSAPNVLRVGPTSCGTTQTVFTYTIVDSGARADLAITKDDGSPTYVPGSPIVYTIVARNNGPSPVTNALLIDNAPATTTATWNCSASPGASCFAASGTGRIEGPVTLPVGGFVTITFTLQTGPDFFGQIVNTATISPPGGVTDPTPGNNTAVDTDNVAIRADLAVTKSSTPNPYVPGAPLTYTVVVTNTGPSSAVGAIFNEPLPAAVSSFTWTCTGNGGATCPAANGTGPITNLSINLPASGSMRFIFTGTVPPGTTGQLSNTATIAPPPGVTDPVPGNNSATETNPANQSADLAITKASSPNPYVPGAALTYTIIVSNRGPSTATGARVQDALPAPLSAFSWTCAASAGASCGTATGTGDINALVTLPPNATATFTVTGTVPSGTTGRLSNTASVSPPAGTTDPVPGNNTSTDTNPANPQADLVITKSSTPNPYVPGAALSYTIVVTNAGASDVRGARVQDVPPTPISGFAWTCTAAAGGSCGTANGVGSIDALVNLPVGATATFRYDGTVPSDAQGALINTATVTPPSDVTDPTPGNNEATDNNGAAPRADLAITKSASPTSHVPGGPLTYTVIVRNNGPSAAFGARVQDTLYRWVAGFTWTCAAGGGGSCVTASGTGSIDALVTLPVGATATFTLTGTVSADALDNITNTATVTPPSGTTDPTPGNNSSSVTTLPAPQADLSITKTGTPDPYVPGARLTYTLVARNAGPSVVFNARVQDPLPPALAGFTWTCAGSSGGNCQTASGSGNVDALVDLPVGGVATFTLTGIVPSGTTGALSNTATIAPPAGTTDPVPGNNTSSRNSINDTRADLVISKSSRPNPYVPGDPLTYTIVASNVGPSDVTGARVQDTLPPALTGFTWTCVGSSGGVCAASGAAPVDELVTLPKGASVTFTITGIVPPGTVGALPNTATIVPPAGTTDPVPGNNTATDTNPANPTADLAISKASSPNPYVPGDTLTFYILALNIGPSDAPGARVQDVLPPQLAAFTWSCVTTSGSACGAASGTGSIDTTLDLLAGGIALFTITGTVPSDTLGVLTNAATITPPTTVTDPVPGNNQSSTTNPANPEADLVLTKSSAPNPFVPGEALTYTILVTNVGPSDVQLARVLDVLPAPFSAFTWTCTSEDGTCSTVNGTGQVDTLVSLPAGGSATISVTGIVPPGTPTTAISNTATVTPPADVTDPTPGNNQDTDVNTGSLFADLSVTKSSTPDPYVPGLPMTYTIRVMNAGPSNAANARVQDLLPARLAGFPWTCVASAGSSCASASGTGSLDTLVSLLVGGTATFTVSGTVPSGTTGPLTNTVTVTPPADVTDLVPGNNTATDVNPTNAIADLSITKSSTPKPYVPGGLLTMTLVVSNAGPSDVVSARVQDALPPTLAGFNWTCVASGGTCATAAGTGDIDALVSLTVGGTATFTISGFTPSGPIVQLTNTATVAPPAGVRDPVSGNNTATDNNPAAPLSDLAITKTAAPDPYVPGAALTYTLVATNNGPTAAVNARVTDTLPAGLNGFSWSCATLAGGGVCVTPNGVGSIDALVTLPAAGASVQFTITGIVPSGTTGTLANTATIAPPPGIDDPDPSNNNASTTTAVDPQTDLAVTKAGSPDPYVPGRPLVYIIVVSNNGPSNATNARVQDLFPAPLAGFGWTCSAGQNARCDQPVGSGSIDTLVDLAAGASVTFTVLGTVPPSLTGSLTNTVTVSPAAGTTDPTPGNNSDTVTSVSAPLTDLAITKVSTPNPYIPGLPLTYAIDVLNEGPSDAVGARLTDTVPPALAGATWSCTGSGGARCATASGTGAIDTLVDVPAGAGLRITMRVTPPDNAIGAIINTASIAPAAGATDPDPTNNSATDTNNAEPRADIVVTKTTDRATPLVGDEVTFTVTARNDGPSNASGVVITDALPAGLAFVSATPSQGAYDSASGNWTVGALANGASATLTLRVRVTLAGTLINTATKTAGDQIDPDTSNNAGAAALTADPVADVRVTKTADATDVNVGTMVTFTITASNAGPSNATGVQLADPLPPGLAFVSAAPSVGTFDPTTGVWTIGNLAVGAPRTLTLTAIVTQAGAIVNVARKVAQNELDPIAANDAGGATVNGLSADIQVIKTVSAPTTAAIGREVRFFITATNNGPSTATGVRIEDRLPSGLAFVSATASRGAYVPQSGLWEIDTLNATGAGATATLELRAIVTANDAIANHASVSTSDQPDPNPLNNSSAAIVISTPIDLEDHITASSDPGLVGSTPTFFIDAVNVGNATSVEPITLAVPLPAEYVWQPGAGGGEGFTCTQVGRTVFCRTEATLITGHRATARLRANVLSEIPFGRALFAHLTTPPDFISRNNVTQLYVGPPPAPDPNMSVWQSVTVSGSGAARTLTYQVTVDNYGPETAQHAVLTDVIPPSATLVSATGPLGPCDAAGQYVSCELGSIVPNRFVTLTIVLSAAAPGVVIHTVSTSSDQFDMWTHDNQSVLSTTLTPSSDTDTDGDGMPDAWESLMGLSVLTADANGDADADGVSNLDEYRRGTHPRGFYKQYFAEGVSSDFFQTAFSALNLSPTQSAGLMFEYMLEGGAIVSEPRRLGAVERVTADPAARLGPGNRAYAALVESDQPLAADRLVSWGSPSYGAHAEAGQPAASTLWHFAEGATGPFELFYLLQNPNATPASVGVDFLLTQGAPISQPVTIAPFGRYTLHVNALPSLAAATMSARVTSDVPIVAERAMYFGPGWTGGTDGAGAPALSTDWFFAEGATGGFFEEFILIANPGLVAAEVTATFARPDGQTVLRTYTIAPQSRFTILVDAVDPLLASTAVAVSLSSTNAVPVVAERAMYWPDGVWQEGHVSLGATTTGLAWAVPTGFVSGPPGVKTYVLIANTSAAAGEALVTLVFDDGTRVSRSFGLVGQSRQTVDIEASFPEAAARAFSVIVESVGATPVPIVVESARYWSTPTQFWAAGTSELATRVH